MSMESRERLSSEYAERKLLLKRLMGLEAQLNKNELLALHSCVAGRTLDLREDEAERMNSLWREQQSFYIDGFRRGLMNQKMGDLLKKMRESQGIAKEEVASIARISARTYAKYERGEANIPTVKMALLLSFFGCDIIALL